MDLWRDDRPDVTFRRLKVLVSQLRPGSRLAQAAMEDTAWTASEYLQAAILDAIAENTWVTVNRGVEKSKQSPRPKPISRPEDIRAERKRAMAQATKARAFRASTHTTT